MSCKRTISLSNYNSGLVSLSLLDAGSGNKKNIEVTTTKDFDEVELVKTGLVSALTNFKLYYAYVSDATCDNNCITYLNSDNYSGLSVNTGSFSNPNNVTNSNLNDFASRYYLLAGSDYITVNTVQTFPAGTQVGFEIDESGLLGLLSLEVLSGITLTTYNGSVVQETLVANSGLADVGVLSNGRTIVAMKTTKPFTKVRIDINITLTLLKTYRVYNAFVVLDNDNDGVPNCVDRCVGNDYFVNENGIPTACVESCQISAGADVSVCPALSAGTVQLNAIGSGYTWSALSSNPSSATISSTGLVQGMSNFGLYKFVVSNSICSDTVQVNYQLSVVDASCNRPLVNPNVVVEAQSPSGGICLLCGSSSKQNVVDGDLNNYLEYDELLSLINPTPLIAVKDTSRIYQSGNRVGFVVSFPDGLLSLDLLGAIQIKTYLNNVLQQTASVGSLLDVGVLAGVGNKARVGFVATQPFNQVELVVGNVLGLLTTIRVYNAFVEPSSCESFNDVTSLPSANCFEVLQVDKVQNTTINYDKTGFSGVACTNCILDSISYIIDDNYMNSAQLKMTVGLLSTASISVKSKKIYTAGYEAGFAISASPSLLDLGVLSNFAIVTYLNGVVQDSILGNSGLLSVGILPGGNSKTFVGFRSLKSFNEIRLLVNSPVSANVISDGLQIYYAYTRLDSDGDGVPDCLDKCCSGSDYLDSDGDGYTDACDVDIQAQGDSYGMIENEVLIADVLSNDEYGYNGIQSFTITSSPSLGTAIIDQNGTPDNLEDDFIVFTPNADQYGMDSLKYTICDSFNVCSEAVVYINIQEGFKAKADSVQIVEDTPIQIDVLANDNFGVLGPKAQAITIKTPPQNGTATVLNQGTPNDPTDDLISYVPNSNFSGTDSIVYEICDADNVCKSATVYIQIDPSNDAPIALDDQFNVNLGLPTVLDVLANDSDSLDLPNGGLDTNSLVIITPPAHGTATIGANGTINYTSQGAYTGPDSLTYRICDTGYPLPSVCTEATVKLNVIDGVFAGNDTVPILEDEDVVIDVLDNDLFGAAGPKPEAITIATPPAHGIATVDDNGTPSNPLDDKITYQPSADFNGVDSFTYQICDVTDNCKTATVYIEVEPVNDPPIANDDFEVLPSSGFVSVNVLANDNDDKDGANGGLDVTSLTIVGHPSHGYAFVNPYTGELIYSAGNDPFGYDTIYYSITDIGYPQPGKSDTAMLVIQYGEPDLTPSIMILPSIIYGESAFDIIIDVSEIAQANTDGSTISLIISKDVFMNINFDANLQNIQGFSLDNNQWTYQSNITGFHVFRTNAQIPSYGTLTLGLNAVFQPQGSNGRKPITVTIQGGGEAILTNNSDVDSLIFFEE